MSYMTLQAKQSLSSIAVLMVFIFISGVCMSMRVYAKANGSKKHLNGYLISQASLSYLPRIEGCELFFCYDLHSRVNKVLASTAINF